MDGVVGDRTWAMLRDRRDAQPKAQPAQADVLAKVTGYAGAATALSGAVAAIGDALPENAMTILTGGAAVAGVMALAAVLFVKIRDGKALF